MVKMNVLIVCMAILCNNLSTIEAAAGAPGEEQQAAAKRESWNNVEGWANGHLWSLPTAERPYRTHPTIEGKLSTAILDLREKFNSLQAQMNNLSQPAKPAQIVRQTPLAQPELEEAEWNPSISGDINPFE